MTIEQTSESATRPAQRRGLPTPTALADRLGVSAATVVFGVVGVAAAAAGGWWALRTPSGPEPEEILPTVDAVSIPLPPPETAAPSPIAVHVAGAVASPGVHELPPGSRVADAVDAAGGLASDADLARLNLAEPIIDGARLWVPAQGEESQPDLVSATPPGSQAPAGDSGSTAAGGALVNVNTADAAALESLPGIGPSLAAAIVEHRERAGPFASVDDLDKVSGIGPVKLERMRPYIGV